MATYTKNYNLEKPELNETADIEVINGNMNFIDTELKNHADNIKDSQYQTPIIAGQQIQLTRQSITKRLYFYLSSDLSGGNITISLDNGATSVPLNDLDGNQLTSLSKGYQEVVDNTSFFTLRPRGSSTGGEDIGFFGKYTGTQLILTDKVKSGNYIYSNEDVELELSGITPTTIDHSTSITACTNVDYMNYIENNKYSPRLLRMSNGWFVTLYNNASTKKVTINISKDNGGTWTKLCEVFTYTNSSSETDIISFSMTVVGMNLYVLHINTAHIYLYTIDTTTGNITNIKDNIDTNQTSFGQNCFIIADNNGKLHASWCSKNSTYSIRFNIRYSSSIDGISWTVPTQVTNSTDNSAHDLYMFQLKNTSIGLLYSTDLDIKFINLTNNIYRTLYSYAATQNLSITVTLLSSGDIWVAWYHKESSYSYGTYYYSKSSDSGNTWLSSLGVIESSSYLSNSTIQIISDFNDNIYALYTYASNSGGNTVLRMKKYISGTWQSATTLITNPSYSSDYAHCVCPNYKYFTSPIIVYRNSNAYGNMLFNGIFTINSNLRLIPSIDNANNESDLIAEGNGTLKTHGYDLKRYTGFVSKESKGWS